jgi:hypothetical protein
LSGLENITLIDSDLVIKSNHSLNSLSGLDNLSFIGGMLSIQGGYAANLSGLHNLASIGGQLNIYGTKILTGLSGLDNLSSIGGDLNIKYNDSLTNLLSLHNVTSIGGIMYIYHNNSLISLAGLDNIESGTIDNLYIFGNDSLSTCDAQSICDYLASPNGSINIHDNAAGCNSQEEVEAACVESTENMSPEADFVIYPNPSSTQITIETPEITTHSLLTIMNLNGQELLKCQITEPKTVVDMTNLPKGIYFVRLTNDRTVEVGKIIKQ